LVPCVRFSGLDGKSIAIWGTGRETTAFRIQLEQRLPATEIAAVIDDDTPREYVHSVLQGVDVLVRSPGVSIYKPVIQQAISSEVTVTTPTGLWLAERRGKRVIGVTGTKGKSTTATVIAQLLKATTAVELAGNIGRAVIELLDLPQETWVVLELSSYQLADLAEGPEVAVITNLYKEHTDWHGSEQQYRADKLRIFGLPGTKAAVYPLGDPEVELAALTLKTTVTFADPGSWHLTQAGIERGDALVLRRHEIPLRGEHNALNVATALAAVEAAGLDRPELPGALAGLQPLPHRLQTVHTTANGTEWVDDSISTTPESTIAALEAFGERPVVLIAGGQDRGQDHEQLAEVIAKRRAPTTLITLPDTGAGLAEAVRAHAHAQIRMSTAGDMRDATDQAAALVQAGGVVLLSPAAPSYNAFKNFEQRGDAFAEFARRQVGARF
jgi:UDP-N-acetylmuramoyl-L-alanine---L-glutamate ligase